MGGRPNHHLHAMKQVFLLFFLLLLPTLPATAGPIDVETARGVALAHLRTVRTTDGNAKKARAEAAGVRLVARNAAAYLFSAGTEGFVLAAADDRLPAVLGYGELGGGPLPASLDGLISLYARQLSLQAERTPAPAAGATEAVPPLLTTRHHQGAPYNNECPYYRYADGSLSGGRCLVGCVATALEQVIAYYRRTVTLADTLHGWSTAHYELPDVLPGASVDTRLVLDDYDRQAYTPEEADAVARLAYYCGMAAHMRWGPDASGARIDGLDETLRRAFGFGYAHYADSYKYAPDAWEQMLGNEIRCGRPVVLTGFGQGTNGHAFVLDGRDSNGLYHVNWGEGGRYDGFFRLDVLNAAEPGTDITDMGMTEGFSINIEALFLHPDPVEVTLPDTLERTGLEISVDSVHLEQTPETGKTTPIRIYFRNTASQTLTTPFEIFTNGDTDEDIFADADYVALTTVTLRPGERCERLVHANFGQAGRRMLRLSPDDRAVPFEMPVDITASVLPELSFAVPEITFGAEGETIVRTSVANPGPGRAGHRITFEITAAGGTQAAAATADDASYVAHVLYSYLPEGRKETAEMRFDGLTPGHSYTLKVRCPWTVRQTVTFTVPETATGIDAVTAAPLPVLWYTPAGRQVPRPARPGLYLRRQGGTTEKIYVR